MSVNIFPQLKENLIAVVYYPQDITDLIGNAQPWRDFCALDQETKDMFAFVDDSEDVDAGYRRRTRGEGREDKELFHYSGRALQDKRIEERGLEGVVATSSVLNTYFKYCEAVHRKATDFMSRIVAETDSSLPGFKDVFEGEYGPKTTLRLLHYTPEEEHDEIIADQHFDRGGFTLHLFESHPGLEYLDWDYNWQPAPMEKGKTVMFTGFALSEFSNETLQKTWHRVVRIKDKENDSKGRISLVLFCELLDQPEYQGGLARNEIPHYKRIG